MKHLNSDPHFLEAAAKYGCSTQKGAENRITRCLGKEENGPLTFVMQVGKKFTAVAVVTDRNSFWLGALIKNNIYTVSA